MNTHMTDSTNIPTMNKHMITINDHNTCCSNNNTSNDKLYKGVRKRKWGKWVSEIRLPNSRERIWLGSYDTQEKAARAFDAALYCLRGRHASFNFPNTPLTINVAVGDHKSLSSQEIQEIASKFANEYSPRPIELSNQDEEEEEDQQVPLVDSQNDANSSSNSNYEYSYSSCPLYDNEGDMRRMDWTFEDMLDNNMNGVANCIDYGLYNGLDNMQYSSELQYSSQVFEEHHLNVDQIECDQDAFSNHSFLWNWNF